MALIKQLLITVLLFGATVLRADVFSFSYGSGVTGTVAASLSGGVYTVTNISGSYHGIAFDGTPVGTGSNYTLTYSGGHGSGEIGFSLGILGIPFYIVDFSNTGSYTESIFGLVPTDSGKNFYIGRVPEPTTLLLLFTMGLGVWVLARKLPAKKRS